MTNRILVVDDDARMALAMERVLQLRGYSVDKAANGREALSRLASTGYAAMITDLRMPVLDGHDLVQQARRLHPGVPVVVVTAYGTVQSAVSCVRNGAVDYLMKPFSPEALERTVSQAISLSATRVDVEGGVDLVAEDPATAAALDLALRAAGCEATVLLEAESGAGKEVFARLIHRESPRAAQPFVAVNCAALPRELLEAELFGHRRGAFTGAIKDRKGHFQAADGGTLLLDEIGEMSGDLQARLLRVLQDRLVQPIGAETPLRIDVRVIAATNRSLRDEVAAGRFREDLYYRLTVFPIRIPPLRDRPADVQPLAIRFAERFAGTEARLTPAVLERLRSHSWPGNVRELQNVVQRAAILAGDDPIDIRHLILEPAPSSSRVATPPRSLEEAEWEAIRRILVETDGNRSRAAAALGISPRTLRHKLKRYRDTGRPVTEPAS